ncbi:hypothetical protein BCR39DRAFT_379536 [Naematelia encephala]|uniref:Uncharacterized protein n=1 Tax=Naematelia encephala TaxID=71784 RepID=A0A1Y2BCP4_9TREE|nr:hypothetical protein BCR39DRAFT_379536 [Naematelia encephala]
MTFDLLHLWSDPLLCEQDVSREITPASLYLAPTRTVDALRPRATQQETNLPSTTVVWIGLAFVGTAASFLGILIANRVIRTQARVRRAQARGEEITFRDLWRLDGGMWGFFTGLGGDRLATSMGMNPDLAGIRRMEEMLRMRLWQLDAVDAGLKRPEMCEVEVDSTPQDFFQPLSITCQAVAKDENGRPTRSPIMDMSFLILLPSPAKPESDQYEDLPDLAIGTTIIHPHVNAPHQDIEESFLHNSSEAKQDLINDVQIEYASEGGDHRRQAGWIKIDDVQWAIEGLT